MVITIRPHHIGFIRDMLFFTQENPTEEVAKSAEKYRAELVRRYDEQTISNIYSFALSLREMPDEKVSLESKCDSVCPLCRFHSFCSAGNYQPVISHFNSVGVECPPEHTPEKADTEAIKRDKLDLSREYTVQELFLS